MKTSPYALEKLMEQTRKLAVEYKRSTGQTLPVSADLALYDIQALYQFQSPNPPKQSIDFVGQGYLHGKNIQVKSRVIFDNQRANYRLGQFNEKGDWDYVILALYDHEYKLSEIYGLDKDLLLDSISQSNKRGALSVNKFKAIGELLWTPELGFEHPDTAP